MQKARRGRGAGGRVLKVDREGIVRRKCRVDIGVIGYNTRVRM